VTRPPPQDYGIGAWCWHVEPLINGGIIRMTVPDKPTSSKQRYVLARAGLKLKELQPDLDDQQQEEDR